MIDEWPRDWRGFYVVRIKETSGEYLTQIDKIREFVSHLDPRDWRHPQLHELGFRYIEDAVQFKLCFS